MKLLQTVFFSTLFFVSGLVNADTTVPQHVGEVKLDGDDGYLYLQSTDGNWNAAGCDNALYVYFVPFETENFNGILSAALTAKAGRLTVSFTGTCDGQTYFKATELFIH